MSFLSFGYHKKETDENKGNTAKIPAPPPLPPSPSFFRDLLWNLKKESKMERRRVHSVSIPPPPPPPLPPPPSLMLKSKSRQRSKGSSVMFFPSFGSTEKEINEKRKLHSVVDIPAPPPLPSPPSSFRNPLLNLKKELKIKRQRVHAATIPPPPPLPPPLTTTRLCSRKR